MKTKTWFPFGLALATVLSIKAQEDTHLAAYLQLYGTNFLNIMTNPIPITEYMGTNLTFRLIGDGGFTNQFRADEQIDYLVIPIMPSGMPEVLYRTFPHDQAFDFHLFDGAGREVPKTKAGLANSQPVHAPKSFTEGTDLKGHVAPFGEQVMFRPSEMFVITNNGTYKLEVRLHIWAIVGFGPKTKDKIWHFDRELGTNAYYGVVTLQPVRAKVIKE
ncbi:MAG: hypothetical protein ABSD57_07690 [Verrucomicrobiota bacterium]